MAYRKFSRGGLSYGAAKSLITKAVRAGKRSAGYARRKSGGKNLLWVILAVVAAGGVIFWKKIKALFPGK